MNTTQRRFRADEQKRLAEIRARWMAWNATADTSTWEATFFLRLIDRKNREIGRLQRQVGKNRI